MRDDRDLALVRHWAVAAFMLGAALTASAGTAVTTSDYAVQASAMVQAQPPQITLNWPPDTTGAVTNYTVSRRLPGTTNWTELTTLEETATDFTDTAVVLGSQYEYEVRKAAAGFTGYGYVLAGIETPLIEQRGTLILIVDASMAATLGSELELLRSDLIGDGWQVLRHDVARTDSPTTVKALIQADYQANPLEVRSVFLIGHVPVPFSGSLFPDGHNPDHYGAWPADVYYADVNGTWSDATVNNTRAGSSRNWNVPGDGKFDTSYHGGVELEIGRVDFAGLPSLNPDETTLLRRYLNKDHAYRHRHFTADRRGMIADNLGVSGGAAYAVNGWRNFAALFGAAAQTAIPTDGWLTSLATNTVLWAYGCGAGSYSVVSGVCSTPDFNTADPGAVFTFQFGSYFGDWDSTDNVMRASLAAPTHTLAVAWAGRPHWFVHPMAQGETIGSCAMIAQNNSGSLYQQLSPGMNGAHTALLGDPTLRLHTVIPPGNLSATVTDSGVNLAWSASSEPVVGYLVYRADTESGPFIRSSAEVVTGTTFTDPAPATNSQIYMVRAVKLETSGGGTYYNASQGKFITAAGFGTLLTNAPVGGSSGNSGGAGDATMTGGSSSGGTIALPNPPEMNGTNSVPPVSPPAATNNPTPPQLSVVNVAVVKGKTYEGDAAAALFRIFRSGDFSKRMVIPISLRGTAGNGTDYRRVGGEVVLVDGQTAVTVAIMAVKDRREEPNETVILTVGKGTGYAFGRVTSALVEISDDRRERR